MTPPLWQKSEEELKSLLMWVKEESEKAGLKLNIKKKKKHICTPVADSFWCMAKTEEELKSLLIRVKEESEKAGLKLSIQKTNIMASALWLIDGGKMQTVTDFLFLGSKITVDGDWSHEIKRLLLGRKAMTDLDSVLKNRHIT